MKIILQGSVPPKKNSRTNTRSGMSFPSKRHQDWEKDVLAQLMTMRLPRITETPTAMVAVFYVPDDRARDLDNMLASILDVLKDQKKKIGGKMVVVREGVFQDDSWQNLRPITLDAEIDRKNPRAEIWLED